VAVREELRYVLRVRRRADGRDADGLGDARRGGQHRGAAQAVAHQDLGRRALAAQPVGGGDQVVHVGGEVGVGEVAGARP
jgi:outer membrane scaffolding protein for murein synthesis (MipA/OmpV family)